MATPRLNPLTTNEQAAHGGFTHMAIVDANALTQATNNTAQTIRLGPIPAGTIIQKVEIRLVTPFKNSADSAFNTTTASLGDTAGGVATLLTAKELNANGTYITIPGFSNTAVGPYAAATDLNITVNAMTGKNLNSVNKGELHVFVQYLDPSILSVAKGAAPAKS